MASPQSSRLDGKVALVTGSSRGMGRQNAIELAARGADLVINYVHGADAANDVVKEIEKLGRKAIAIQADMSKPAEIADLFDQAVKHYSQLNIVVSNSGVESFEHISKITPEEFDRVFHINTRGQLLVAQQAYKHLSTGGHLIMLSSISAKAKGVKNHAVYSGSKAAVEAFARCLASDMGDKKITVNAIAPGGIQTDMAAEAARMYLPADKQDLPDEEVVKLIAGLSPLDRSKPHMGYPQDVARVVAFLASDDSEWVNGQTIEISGGAMM
ncbi:NAD(P)-binding protein [Rhizodiscina lignyota]|uniref:NAD(P)-binding protein n=1 Tax=Rhizodiscina lignyota TaxID=1504668 RepID=A0A9P4IJ92_9PEZI|nr:NAD(P)-binding protein [Rhizodiscina lignyota]